MKDRGSATRQQRIEELRTLAIRLSAIARAERSGSERALAAEGRALAAWRAWDAARKETA